ncbi:MAG: hypothetical protein SWK76_00810 [Actinomycetota bacterium]|nr:hypothetical protein [Actinomycetota bacterium]
MEDRRRSDEDGLEKLREMTTKLEEDLDEKEAVDLLEKAVEEAEERGKDLEEGEA